MSFGERLKNARIAKRLTQRQLSEIIGARHNSVSNWENDRNHPDADTILKLCEILEVSPSHLFSGNGFNFQKIDNLLPITTKKIPLLGDIACGEPILCNSEIDCYVDSENVPNADFALRAKGDSMINARINDGDIVFIRSQPQVENGEIAAVCINDEATLKRVYINNSSVTLVAENPLYPPITYNLSENSDIHILGKAVAFLSRL